MRQKMGLEKLTLRHWLGGLVVIIGLIGLITVLIQQQLEKKTIDHQIDHQIDQMSPEELQASPTALAKKEEDVLNGMPELYSGMTTSADECDSVLKDRSTCYVVKSATLITRPEWQELFPHTQFFLVKGDSYGGESLQKRSYLTIEQAGKQYSAENFGLLLHDNGVVITDENRELVAQTFALITIPDHLSGDIVFTLWSVPDPDRPYRHNYNYLLKSWTPINGVEFQWWYIFKEGKLMLATGPGYSQLYVGDYVSKRSVSLPPVEDYRFRGGQ